MSHVTYQWVMSRMNESCHIFTASYPSAAGMSHIWISHATRRNESCHIWMSHVEYGWVMSHIYSMRKWVTSHTLGCVLQCVAVGCSALQCVMNGSRTHTLRDLSHTLHIRRCVTNTWVMAHTLGCVLQCFAVCCSVLWMGHDSHIELRVTHVAQHVTHIAHQKISHKRISHVTHIGLCVAVCCLRMWMSHDSHNAQHVTHTIHQKICHDQISHVTYEWVIPHMNESCHAWMTYVTYEWVMSHMN